MIQFSPEVPKDPIEVLELTMDFTQWLQAGETIATCPWICTVSNGTDPSPSSLLSGSPTIAAGLVKQLVHGGLDGVTYLFEATATTNLGHVYVGRATLAVAGLVW